MTSFDIQFGRYRFFKSGFSAGQILDRLGIHVLGQVLGHKMGETSWGLNTSSEGNKVSFLTPTQTHVFDNCSNCYVRLSTSHVRSSSVAANLIRNRF
jgi:hypothetical protein